MKRESMFVLLWMLFGWLDKSNTTLESFLVKIRT